MRAGTYIIMIAPKWHESANLDPEYYNVRVGLYSPRQIKIEKFKIDQGLRAIALCFEDIARNATDS